MERAFPGAFYAPLRWGTPDGCMPFRVCWAYFHALDMGRALEALDTARGIGLAFGGEDGRSAIDDVARTAFPRA